MSQNESFEFLADVKLNDVKKVWKKAITGGNNSGGNASAATAASANTNATTGTGTSTSTSASAEKNNNILPELMNNSNHNSNKSKKDSKETILKFYTVGDGSVKTLAKNYTLQAAAKAIEEEKDNLEAKKEKDEEEIMKKYVSCFLDVPADRSGGKPHQGKFGTDRSEK
jgi:transcriptional regulator of nitric oxide reductase